MKTIEVIGQVDEHHRLSAQVPPEVPPGRVKLSVTISSDEINHDEDDAGQEWSHGIARQWQDELADSRQDVYTLSDGEPVDAR